MTRVRIASAIAVALTASLLLARVHPFGDAGLYAARTTQPPILQQSSIPSNVRDILVNKCADCHSAQTRTPIYGHFAPISWMLERHIIEARKSMDLSGWDTYSPDQQQTLIAKIIQQTKSGAMPLPQYRLIHRSTRITATDIQALTQWAHSPSTASDSAASDPATLATTAGDPTRGATLFDKRCTGCHALAVNREGPRMQGIYGRATGAVVGFPYSAALQNAHITWNDQSLEKWLADPDAFLPGNNMDFLVPKPQERKDLIAYLKQTSTK